MCILNLISNEENLSLNDTKSSQYTVGEKDIGAPKILNKYGAMPSIIFVIFC